MLHIPNQLTKDPVLLRVINPAATRVASSLSASQAAARRLAAEWLKDLANPEAVPALQAALDKERSAPTKTALLAALAAAGTANSFDFKQFEAEAKKGMSKARMPRKLSRSHTVSTRPAPPSWAASYYFNGSPLTSRSCPNPKR